MLFVFDDYELDTQACELRRAGTLVKLAPKVYHVLAYLIQHRDRLISKEDLLEQLWPDTYVDDSAVKRTIMAARRAIGDRSDSPKRIKTLRAQGYRFIASVTAYDHMSSEAKEPAIAAPPLVLEMQASEPTQATLQVVADTRCCAVCQHVNSAAARFCVACGAPSGTICANCGQTVSLPATFCPLCGQRLAALCPPGRAPFMHTSLEFQPVQPQQSTQDAPVGERKLVTVLCGILDHVPCWGEKLGLDAMHSLLQTVYELTLAEIKRYTKTIQSITGEGFLALFGAPVAQEDHARRAVLAALGLQRRLHEQRASLQLPYGEGLAFSMALHTGLVVVGQLGDDPDRTAMVIGDTTTLAAAMARRAKPGTILASDTTLQLVQGEVHTAVIPPLHLDEQSAPISVSQIVTYVPRRVPLAATVARARSLFVGREAELAILHERWARAQTGQGQVVGIVGEPGKGKSRLLYEFRQQVMTREVNYLQGACRSYGSVTSYLPILDLLRDLWGITDVESAETVTTRVHEGLQAVELELDTWAPYFLHLLGVKSEPKHLADMPPEVIKARTFEALHQLTLCSSRRVPCILEVEDLHWIDTTSDAYLAALVERLAGAPILLLLTFRPGSQPTWLDKSYATQMALQPLGSDDSRQMVQAILGHTPIIASLEQRLLAKAEGNPFFLEELAYTVAEKDGRQPILVVPDTIQAVLTARIDRLLPEEKRLLQTAAVIGTEVSFPLLHAIAGLSEETLCRLLAHLQAAEFLYETRLFPELVYTFKHTLTQEVTYGSLLQEQRRVLHTRIVNALETLYAEHLDDQIDQLAHHALGGQLWDKAFRYFRQAGAKAMERAAHREAAVCFEQALSALRQQPKRRATREQTIDLLLDLRNALLPLGANERLLDVLREAAPLAKALADPRRLGWLSCYMSTQHLAMGDAKRAITSGQRALVLATTCGDVALQVTAPLRLGLAYHVLGDYRQAIEVLRRNWVALKGALRQERFGLAGLPAVHTCAWLVWCLAETGAFREGLSCGAEVIRLAEAADRPYDLLVAYGSVGLLYLRKGELHQAIPLLEQGLALHQKTHIPLVFPTVASSLGAAYALAGRVAEALPLLEQAVAQAASMHMMVYHALPVMYLSEAYLLSGRLDDANELALRACDVSRDHKEWGHQAWTLRLLAEIASYRDPPEHEQAEAYFRQALAQSEKLGMRPLSAHCHLGLGNLHGQRGQLAKADIELSAAVSQFRSLDMTYWLHRAEHTIKKPSAHA